MVNQNIPDDIMKSAERWWMNLPAGVNADPECKRSVARLVMAERKRCHRVASFHAYGFEKCGDLMDPLLCLKSVVDYIQSGENSL